MIEEQASEPKHEQNLLEQFRTAVADDLELMSRLHRKELDVEFLSGLKAGGFPDNLGFRLTGAKGLEAFKLSHQAMTELPDAPDQELLNDLAVDFANIYLIYKYRASPCESVWLDDEHLARQQPMFQIQSEYRRHRLVVSADYQHLSDDHLSLQFEFIAYLLRQTDKPENLGEVARFMDEHLLRWIADFARQVITYCATPFYGSLAVLTATYSDELRNCLARILEQPRPSAEQIEQRMGSRQTAQEAPLKYVPGVTASW